MFNLVISNIRQRPLRALVCIVGVALGVVLVMLFTGLADGMSKDLQRRSSNVQAEILFTRSGSMQMTSSSANLSTAYVERLKTIDGVASVTPVILYVSQGSSGFGFERVEGVEWSEFAAMNNITIAEGRAPVGANEVVVDEQKKRNDNLALNSEIKLFGNQPYRVVGFYTPESGARVKMSLAAMQEALEAPDKCTYILVKVRDGATADEVAGRISTELPGNKLQLTRDFNAMSYERRIPFLGTFLRVLVALAAVVSTLVVMLAMYTTITERTRDIGTLKALGASRALIINTIIQEALVMSVIGLLLGFVAAIIAGYVIERFSGLLFAFSWQWALAAIVIGILGGALGALYPAQRAANLDPVEALAHE